MLKDSQHCSAVSKEDTTNVQLVLAECNPPGHFSTEWTNVSFRPMLTTTIKQSKLGNSEYPGRKLATVITRPPLG